METESFQQSDMEELLENITTALMDGATYKDIHGIPQGTMDGIYSYAYEFYQQGKLKEAETFFRFLSIYDFYNTDYVMGLAAVYQLTKRYDKATELYALAFVLAKNDYRPLFHAGQCNLMLKKSSAAIHCFESVVKSSADVELRNKSQAYLTVLEKNLKQTESEHKENDIE
ncbi:type III secretion system translocator chaperone SicA [Providencia hangzhouensis]|uniref:Type III secretion system translocator chaperone SicA n=1 Tax=Providencia rettgeri TaxID=587 RepID=A0AAJ4NMN6_PRORE|nr:MULTISPECIES: type III secretion system translocator chaperone SicA [Providencia]MDB9567993.1 type III secretion system translocator chaperone SicA [Providencia rettgeri]QWQ18699.2 type III secretion system translocator chaperone SicA [Providencia rettgeri]QWQ22533.2 type III secretion system translocator chaperone SicA [Providencia rettgeri]QWQ26369.2 type III secretion system translocator chaperone SicA [Providencia rettgeri]WOB92849.1 type III secretion system translocator chaperone SicA